MIAKSKQTPIRVALLDDHELILEGMAYALRQDPRIEVVGAFSRSQELFLGLAALATPVDIVLTDFSLSPSENDGANLIRQIDRRLPNSRCIVISALHTPAMVTVAIKAGARGFYGKELPIENLIDAVVRVQAGDIWIDPDMQERINEGSVHAERLVTTAGDDPLCDDATVPLQLNLARLTQREVEVLRCLLDGLTVTQTAAKFSRSIKTISAQKQSAFHKLGIGNNNELFKSRVRLGFGP